MERRVIIAGLAIATSILLAATLSHTTEDPASRSARAQEVDPPKPQGDDSGSTAGGAVTATRNAQPDHPGFYAGEAGMTPSERAGREIWYKATAGNSRFHSYT